MIDINAIANAAAEHDKVPGTAGGFTKELPREGVALLRLQSYVELGLHKSKNPTYKPTRNVLLRFELLHPDHIISGKKEDGTEYSFPDTVSVNLSIGGPTSRFGKLFSKMNYDNDASFMYQLIGKAFLGSISHNTVGEGKDAKTYVNIQDAKGEWTIGAPVMNVLDALGVPTDETKPVPVPELQGEPQMFLYNKAGLTEDQVKAMWDDIYIDGEYEAVEATDTAPARPARSKNWIQNKIRESVDYDGSITQRVDLGNTLDLPEETTEEVIESTVTALADVDPLKALGL